MSIEIDYGFDTPIQKGIIFELMYYPPSSVSGHEVMLEIAIWWRFHWCIEWGPSKAPIGG
jgi:hypothetical protein